MDQIELFSGEHIALWAITEDFNKLYPGLKYNLIFERNLCDEENL